MLNDVYFEKQKKTKVAEPIKKIEKKTLLDREVLVRGNVEKI